MTSSTFRSLQNRNYRLYFSAQLVSLAGTFMQVVAQTWLVLQLTGSGTALGLLTTLQFGPILLLTGPAGVIVDRIDRRRLYVCTQTLAGLEALVLGLLVVSGSAELWMVYVLAVMLGTVSAFDLPAKQTLLLEIVGPRDLTNAVSLNMALGSTSRAVGPALAGITIATLGVGPCFLINAASFVPVVAVLLCMRKSEMHPTALQPRGRGQFRAGLSYVRRTPELASILVTGGLLFMFAWEFEVSLPLMSEFVFHGGASTYGILTSVVGIGAVLGGLESARRARPSRRGLAIASAAFAIALWCATVAPNIAVEAATLFLAGATGIAFISIASSRLQLHTDAKMRGRVMALWTVAGVGTRVIGGPIVGWFGQHLGARSSLAIGAVTATVLVPVWWLLNRRGTADTVPGSAPSAVQVDSLDRNVSLR